MKKIALEEHVLLPGFEDYWQPLMVDVPEGPRGIVANRLYDFGEQRLKAMDDAGIDHAILSLSGPGVQAERDTPTAIQKAREANDLLAREVGQRRERYSGFAHLALQDGSAAADELQRCVNDLGFKGALINGHTNGLYLDDPSLYGFWERVQELGTVVYLHPGDPVAPFPVLDGHVGLKRATWEWTIETGSHALRLIFGGHFDRFPGTRLVLGHLGETLPYLLWRLDSRAGLYGVKLARKPSEYIRDNFMVTMSGMFSREPLLCAIDALGSDNVMFSADYPYESASEAADFIESVTLPDGVRDKVCHANAERTFKIGQSNLR